jgi:hypothetical protein
MSLGNDFVSGSFTSMAMSVSLDWLGHQLGGLVVLAELSTLPSWLGAGQSNDAKDDQQQGELVHFGGFEMYLFRCK